MLMKKSSLVQLEKVWIDEIELKESPAGANPDIRIDMDFEPMLAKVGGKELKAIQIKVDINKNIKNPKIRGRLKITGAFSLGEDAGKDEEERIRNLVITGLNILYGMARGLVFQRVSSVDPAYRVLPVIDLRDLINKKTSELAGESEEEV